jgi:two-component system, OmpR family, heavy metal sensor histidine kinase CusS
VRLLIRRSITFRLTLLFAAASAAVLLVLGFLIDGSVVRHFAEQDREMLTGKLQLVQHALEKVQSPRDLDTLPQQLDNSLIGHPGLAVVVLAQGQTLFATSGADFPQPLLEREAVSHPAKPMIWKTREGKSFRGISAPVPLKVQGWQPAVVAVATDISHQQHFMASFLRTLWLVVILAAVLTGFLGWMAARRGLAPLQSIRQGAAGITANHLDYRLAVDSVPVELEELVETLNEMLSRLQASFQRLADFSSDLAHELRTPVSNLMTQTQVALSQPRPESDYLEILYSNLEELERLARMIGDMLFLAKADNGLMVPNLENVDLASEIDKLIEFYEALADERNVTLARSGSAAVRGDPIMLRRAIGNLLSNAIRHATSGSTVRVEIGSAANDGICVAVENLGQTIPPEHLARLFDRFYRINPARSHESDGAGLGLAITKSIIAAHGGKIAVSSEGGVTRLMFTLA